MSEEKTEPQKKVTEDFDPVKQAKADSQTPEQKHARYLQDLERIHNEP